MKTNKLIAGVFAALALAAFVVSIPAVGAQDKPAKSMAELEKEKAMANPYPNDLGPEKLDEATLKSYPANVQEGYKALLGTAQKKNCQVCHSAARPLNSRFVEPEGKDEAAKEAAVAALKKSQPELFKDASIWQVESGIWRRYVRRMMFKPGCNIDKATGKKIWEFMVYDGAHRKIGANAQKWKEHREKLLAEFKAKYPARYKQLLEDKDL